jgi:hypothetical protein
MTSDTDEVLAVERGFWTQANDPSYFAQNIADGGLSVIEPLGFVEREQVVAMPADRPWLEVEMHDVVIRQISADCIILAYHGRGRREGDAAPYLGSIASAYVRQDGRWRLAISAHQPWAPKA